MPAPGGVAQLGERYVRNVEVTGSSPVTSIRYRRGPLGPRLGVYGGLLATAVAALGVLTGCPSDPPTPSTDPANGGTAAAGAGSGAGQGSPPDGGSGGAATDPGPGSGGSTPTPSGEAAAVRAAGDHLAALKTALGDLGGGARASGALAESKRIELATLVRRTATLGDATSLDREAAASVRDGALSALLEAALVAIEADDEALLELVRGAARPLREKRADAASVGMLTQWAALEAVAARDARRLAALPVEVALPPAIAYEAASVLLAADDLLGARAVLQASLDDDRDAPGDRERGPRDEAAARSARRRAVTAAASLALLAGEAEPARALGRRLAILDRARATEIEVAAAILSGEDAERARGATPSALRLLLDAHDAFARGRIVAAILDAGRARASATDARGTERGTRRTRRALRERRAAVAIEAAVVTAEAALVLGELEVAAATAGDARRLIQAASPSAAAGLARAAVIAPRAWGAAPAPITARRLGATADGRVASPLAAGDRARAVGEAARAEGGARLGAALAFGLREDRDAAAASLEMAAALLGEEVVPEVGVARWLIEDDARAASVLARLPPPGGGDGGDGEPVAPDLEATRASATLTVPERDALVAAWRRELGVGATRSVPGGIAAAAAGGATRRPIAVAVGRAIARRGGPNAADAAADLGTVDAFLRAGARLLGGARRRRALALAERAARPGLAARVAGLDRARGDRREADEAARVARALGWRGGSLGAAAVGPGSGGGIATLPLRRRRPRRSSDARPTPVARARAAAEAGETNLALRHLVDAREVLPDRGRAPWPAEVGRVRLWGRRSSTASRDLRLAWVDGVVAEDVRVATDARSLEARIAGAAEAAGFPRVALDAASRRIALDPGDAAGFVARGGLLRRLGQLGAARADLERALGLELGRDGGRRRSVTAGAWLGVASLASAAGEDGRTEVALANAIRSDPTHPRPWRERGHLYARRGKYARALADYGESLALDRKQPAIYNNIGTILHVWRRDHEAARSYFDRALELEPDLVTALRGRAVVSLQGFGDLDAAERDFTRLEALEPDSFFPPFNRALIAARRLDVDTTIAALRRSLARGLEPRMNVLKDQSFDRIRSDPRFAQFVDESFR